MEEKTDLDSLKILKVPPLRGKVALQADSSLTNFLITLSIILNKKISLEADFLNPQVADYVNVLNNYGITVSSYGDSAFIQGDLTLNESFVLSLDKTYEKYITLLILSKRGYINLTEDKDLIEFFSYLGFICKKDLNGAVVYNKTTKKRSTITFYNFNYDYILLSILALLLNNEDFTIFIPEITPSLKMLFSLLKDIGVVEKIEYGKFIGIYFNLKGIKDDLDNIKVPPDYKEFIFFSVATLITKGDLEITDVNTAYFANSLKLLSNYGASYDAFEDSQLRFWFSAWPSDIVNDLSEDGVSTKFTRLCLLALLPLLPSEYLPHYIRIDAEKYKSLIQDLNTLGFGLGIDSNGKKSLVLKKSPTIRKGIVMLEENQEDSNFVRLLSALLQGEGALVYHMGNLLNYNNSLLDKLSNIGLDYEYDSKD